MPNYKSGLERTIAVQLQAAKVGFTYESLKVPYSIDHIYNPDFMLENGVIVETKGFFRKGETQKMKTVKSQHPELDIRFVFSEADKKISGQKTTHAQWAERHGFPWAEGRIPEEWLK